VGPINVGRGSKVSLIIWRVKQIGVFQ